jgi:hypothetical protein
VDSVLHALDGQLIKLTATETPRHCRQDVKLQWLVACFVTVNRSRIGGPQEDAKERQQSEEKNQADTGHDSHEPPDQFIKHFPATFLHLMLHACAA